MPARLGWLTGCASKTVIVEQEKTQVRETVEVEKEVTKVVEKEVEAQPSEPMATQQPQPTPSPLPTATAAPQATATPSAQPTPAPEVVQPSPTLGPQAAPPLLGSFAPETLYWAPEAITDASGRLTVDFALPGIETSWRVSVLASTRGGEIGSVTARLDVTR